MRKNNVTAVLSSLVLTVSFAGCMNQNPYPGTGVISTNPAEHTNVPPANVIDAPTTVQFQEGKAGTFTVVSFAQTGPSELEVSGLPIGASFDYNKGIFTWTPDMNAGHDQNNPNIFKKDYTVVFTLRSSADHVTVLKTVPVLIEVNGVAQPMDIATDGTALELNEGQSLNVAFTVVSPDFPQGHFAFHFTDLPEGAKISPSDQDPTVFNFSFTPGFNFVTNQDGTDANGYVKTVHLTAIAEGPRAQSVTKAWDVTVHDLRQLPAVSVADNLTFSYAADFSVFAEDLNGETTPSIAVDKPAFGTLTQQDNKRLASMTPMAASSGHNPIQQTVIHWTDIPVAQLNIPQSLTIHACANSSPTRPDVCTKKVVNMTFVGKIHNAPTFDRSGWQRGEIKFIRAGNTLTTPMAVVDPDTSTSAPVTVNPVAMQSEVSFSSGALVVTPSITGTRTFELVSDSAFGAESHESFTMNVLPKDWGSMMLLGQSKADPEVQATLPDLSDAQVVGPMELGNNDEFAQRTAAFVTTSSVSAGLLPGELGSLLGNLEAKLTRVIVSTPLTAKFPRPSLPDDLTLVGRFSKLQIPNKPVLNALSIVPVAGSVFNASKKPVKLNQTLTNESSDPMTFAVNPSGDCTVVMNLVKGTVSIPVAVECTLDSGNKVLFTGFEWGDMAFDSADASLAQTWLQAWLAKSPSPKNNGSAQ